MHGTITFGKLEDLATFLKAFTGSTAIFKVKMEPFGGGWVLEFTGGF